MTDGWLPAAVAGAFIVAGLVKGVTGLGLPAISLALLTAVIGLPQAMALMLVPSFVTNLWQASVGGNGRVIARRIWPFLLMAIATVWVGTLALRLVDVRILSGLLGVLIATYASVNLLGFRAQVSPARERAVGIAVGAVNGVFTGMTGAFMFPGVMYLQAIGLPRDMLVQAMGMLFSLSTLALAIALGAGGMLDMRMGGASALAVVPALAGVLAGQAIRHTLPEATFRRVFFATLLVLGLYTLASALLR